MTDLTEKYKMTRNATAKEAEKCCWHRKKSIGPLHVPKGKKSGRGVRIGTHTTRRGKTKCKRVKDNRVKAGAKVEEGTI